MKKKDLKNLRTLAAQLPPYYQESVIKVTGEQILKENEFAKDEAGNPINPLGLYDQKVMVAVNHYRALKNAMKTGGVNSAKKYLSEMSTAIENTVRGQAEIQMGMAERKAMLEI